jgi:hypothetical protein
MDFTKVKEIHEVVGYTKVGYIHEVVTDHQGVLYT